jgi:hypothetical protein
MFNNFDSTNSRERQDRQQMPIIGLLPMGARYGRAMPFDVGKPFITGFPPGFAQPELRSRGIARTGL